MTESESAAGVEEGIEKSDIRNVPKGVLKEFIETYKAHPALWQIKNKNLYMNINLKRRGYAALLKIWRKYDPEADEKTVKQKIQSLRGSFRKELKKVETSYRSGRGSDEIYQSHLWYFSRMHFLTDHELPTNSIDNIGAAVGITEVGEELLEELERPVEENERNENENMRSNSGPGCSATTNVSYVPAKRQKISEERERRIFMAKCTEALSTNLDESEAFGQYIGKKLNKVVNQEQRMYAEALLTKVLNKALLNKLSSSTDINETSSGTCSYSSSAQSAIPSPQSFTSIVMSPGMHFSPEMEGTSSGSSNAFQEYYNNE